MCESDCSVEKVELQTRFLGCVISPNWYSVQKSLFRLTDPTAFKLADCIQIGLMHSEQIGLIGVGIRRVGP